jgi:phosphatidylglycerophosphate synthase
VVFHDSIQKPIDPGFGGGGGMAPAADLVVLPARLLGISGAWKTPQVGPIRLALEQAAAEGVVNTVSASTHGYLDARMPEGHKLAEQMLHRSLRTVKGSLDGAIDRFVNRKLSGVLTKAFIWLGLSPNVITILSMVIGLAGAVCFAHGLYFWGIVGALLFQLSVIIDCCDGEVARLTFPESPFGQELDIIADNIVHMAIFASIAWGSYAQGVWGESQLPLILGTVAVLANGLSLWLVNRVRYLKSNPLQWRRLAGGQRERLEFILSHVANRDFSVLVLLCAVFQVLPWFLGVAAIGSTFFVLTMLWTLRSSLLSSD